jgi:hypothetical protein
MSQYHKPAPRQDRRNVGRSPVRDHAGCDSVGTVKPAANRPTILDPKNGSPWGNNGGSSAPGANGPAMTYGR